MFHHMQAVIKYHYFFNSVDLLSGTQLFFFKKKDWKSYGYILKIFYL